MHHAGSRAAGGILTRSFPGSPASLVCGAEAGTQKTDCGCPLVPAAAPQGWTPAPQLPAGVRSGDAGQGTGSQCYRGDRLCRRWGGSIAAGPFRGAGSPCGRAGAEGASRERALLPPKSGLGAARRERLSSPLPHRHPHPLAT